MSHSWPPGEFSTSRLLLRKPHPADAEVQFSRLSGDAAVTRYLGWLCHASITQTRQQISHDLLRADRGAAWTWALLQQGSAAHDVAGFLQLTRHDHVLRLGYALRQSCWGQGLMAEAIAAVCERVFEQAWAWRLEAQCDVDNHASRRLLEKLGWCCEGRLRRGLVHPNVSSEPRDVWLYALTRD
ncbi:GNAT family N-acetyltransferase [Viridibacterium curvum]|uniref:GNAT family protein n=1 Tax=Viridibacterium curvum TaxID=1101404 RepID=A0ABP9R6J1_9RHOO